MGSIEFIADCLAGVHIRLLGSCNGMTRDQALWRPAPHANNIGFLLWHVAVRGRNRREAVRRDHAVGL